MYIGYYGKDAHLSGDTTKPVISRGVPISRALEDGALIDEPGVGVGLGILRQRGCGEEHAHIDEGFALVKGQCTGCHSAKLITHSRKTREGWIDSIRWMQRNQGLGALGSTEEPIVSYLAKHYPVPKTAPWRRPPLPAHLMPR